jgi:hypothetical protein
MSASFDCFIERVHGLLQTGCQAMTPRQRSEYHLKSEPVITAGLAMTILQLIDDRAVPGISRAWSVVDRSPVARQPRTLHYDCQVRVVFRKRFNSRQSGFGVPCEIAAPSKIRALDMAAANNGRMCVKIILTGGEDRGEGGRGFSRRD